MSLAMQEGRDFVWSEGDAEPAALKFVEGQRYEPDLTAYKFDPANDRRETLKRELAEGKVKGVDISLGCIDGRREFFTLSESDVPTYFGMDFEDRHAFFNRKITERRLTKALAAHRKLTENGGPFAGVVTPDEEACLREFDGIVTRAGKLREGDRVFGPGLAPETTEVVRRDFGRLAETMLPLIASGASNDAIAKRLREDDGFWDGSGSPADGYYRPWSDREYLSRGGPAYRQQLIADVWDAQAKNYYAWSHDPVVLQNGHAPHPFQPADGLTMFGLPACAECGKARLYVAHDADLRDVPKAGT